MAKQSAFETIQEPKAAGVFCGTLANGDTFGDPVRACGHSSAGDDTTLDLDGRRIPKDSLALAAASQALEATSELLRYAREGDNHPAPFGDVEVVAKLCDALKLAIEVETGGDFRDDEIRQLYGAACNFVEGWAG